MSDPTNPSDPTAPGNGNGESQGQDNATPPTTDWTRSRASRSGRTPRVSKANKPVEDLGARSGLKPVEPYYANFPEQDLPPGDSEQPLLRPRKERIRSVALVGVRVVAGTVGVAVAAAVVAAVVLVPIPSVTGTAPSAEITPATAVQELVCPGPLLRLSDESGQGASTATAVGSASVVATAEPGGVIGSLFAASDAGNGGTESAPLLLSTPTVNVDLDSAAPLISGAQGQAAESADGAGLAAATCAVATGDSWLVGGSTATGRTTLLTLSNPSKVAASVDLEVFGETGAIASPGLTGITVEAGSQRVLSLAGFAPQTSSPVVHVTSSGGLVVANLQQTTTRGIDAGGVEIVGASASPSTTNVMTGVVIVGGAEVSARLGEAGFEDLQTALRVYIPGTETVSARVEVIPEDGSTTGTEFAIDVQGGVAADLPIDSLPDGSYTVRVETDVPAVAAVRTATLGGVDGSGRTDFGWTASAPLLEETALVSTPGQLSTLLHLANPDSSAAEITVTTIAVDGTAGEAVQVPVAAGPVTALPVEPGRSYRLTGFDSLYAGVSVTSVSGLASFTVDPPAVSSSDIVVYP